MKEFSLSPECAQKMSAEGPFCCSISFSRLINLLVIIFKHRKCPSPLYTSEIFHRTVQTPKKKKSAFLLKGSQIIDSQITENVLFLIPLCTYHALLCIFVLLDQSCSNLLLSLISQSETLNVENIFIWIQIFQDKLCTFLFGEASKMLQRKSRSEPKCTEVCYWPKETSLFSLKEHFWGV